MDGDGKILFWIIVAMVCSFASGFFLACSLYGVN